LKDNFKKIDEEYQSKVKQCQALEKEVLKLQQGIETINVQKGEMKG